MKNTVAVRDFRGLVKSKIPDKYLNQKKIECKRINMLKEYLEEGELNFFHDYLADFDIYSTINSGYGERNWTDICFATANTLFYLLTGITAGDGTKDGEVITLYYHGGYQNLDKSDVEITTHSLVNLRKELTNYKNITLIEIQGTNEGHGFVIYPLKNKKVLLIQSVGGIMTANMRLWDVDVLIDKITQLITVSPTPGASKSLFGYETEGNIIDEITFISRPKRDDINSRILIAYIANMKPEQVKLMQDAFIQYYDEWNLDLWEEQQKSQFDFDKVGDPTRPFFYVDPITLDWRCVDRGYDIPESAIGIALRNGAACFRTPTNTYNS